MSDENVTITVPKSEVEYVQQLAQREQAQQQELAARVPKINEAGYHKYGQDRFDAAAQTLANKLGPRMQDAVAALARTDKPHEHIIALANDEARLSKLAEMSAERMQAEFSHAENRSAPFGRAMTRTDPMYLSPALTGKELMSDSDWNSGASDALDDATFFKNVDARLEKRNKDRGGRW